MNHEQILKMSHERIRWACRRGMLELDLFLVPFFEHCYQALTPAEKATFEQLLTSTDPALYQNLMNNQPPENVEEAALVSKIRAFRHLHSQRSRL